MAVGKFSDWPWKGTLMGFFLFFITYAACSYAIVFPILGATMSGAPSAAEAQKKFPEAYGFWLRGNSSFFAPGIMNRTDFNQSSPTYLHWTPPPEWRDYCIESSGMPISACSYFQYEEYPGFMTFFFVAMVVLQIVWASVCISWAVASLPGLFRAFKTVKNSEAGLKAFATPWAIDAVPGCTQAITVRLIQPFLFVLAVMPIPMMFLASTWTAEGYGLLNSANTGKLYFGALWNEFPLPSRDTVPDTHLWAFWPMQFNFDPFLQYVYMWKPWVYDTFLTPVSGFSYGHLVLLDVNQSLVIIWILCQTKIAWINKTIGASQDKNVAKGATARIFGYPDDIYSRKSWYAYIIHEGLFQPRLFFFQIAWTFTWPLIMCVNVVTKAEILSDGDDGMLKYLNTTHWCGIILLPAMSSFALYWQFVLAKDMASHVTKSKHLMSGEMYKSRIKVFADWTHRTQITTLYMVIAYTVCLPHGMAMQVFGIADITSWPMPANYLFSQEGASANLLGAPVHTLIAKGISTFIFARYYSLKYS